jgi:Bacterial Ig-like domain
MNLSIAAKFGIFALSTVAVLASCDNGPAPIVDTTAPTIVASSVTPTGTAVAVSTNKISVTFNEEMDPSVLAGVISFTLPTTGAPTVSAPAWSNGNKTYSVTLSALTAPTNYKFKVAGIVKDKAGNKYIPGTTEYSFSTVTTTPPTGLQPTADVAANINGFYKPDASPVQGPTNFAGIRVGYTVDGVTGAPDGIAKAFYSFNLPAGLTTAKIKTVKLTLVPTPTAAEGATGDGTNLFGIGNVRVESLVYAAATLSAADFASAGTLPVNITSNTGFANIDVTAAVKADVTGGRAKSQFRASLVEPAVRPTKGSFVRLGSTSAPAANQPTLVIEYNP